MRPVHFSSMMQIVPFQESHLEAAAEIAFLHWEKEHRSADAATRKLIYRYLVRYYFCPESALSLAAEENNILYGYLLAHAQSNAPFPANAWLQPQLSSKNRETLAQYTAYLDGNRQKEMAHLTKDEIILDLFASRRPGTGKLLMKEFRLRARNAGFRTMLLWTDDTCDFTYYYHNGFTEAAKMATFPTFDGHALTTYIFRKTI